MNVLVLNGSPKGKYSITIHTSLFIEKNFTEDTFEVLHVGQQIKQFEKDMSTAITAIEKADIVVFCYPVYTFLVPYQLHRFIELLKEQNIDLSNKFATQISTSKHFYDVTAHRFIRENSLDLGFKYLEGFSADMDDLLDEKGQKQALDFWKMIHFSVDHNVFEQKNATKIKYPLYNRVFLTEVEKSQDYDTVIVTNSENDESLDNLIADFQSIYPYKSRIINIADYKFSGGCLGCFRCASTGDCIYKDNFQYLLRDDIQKANAIVYAFTIKDHSMGASFKIYDDRQFCNGHRQMNIGTPIAYLVNGDLASETNLQNVIQGRAEVGHNFLAGVATSENAQTTLPMITKKLEYALKEKILPPQNFFGVGGMKIFRDLIYTMRGLMKEDHKYYKKLGIYKDYPQNNKLTLIKMVMLGSLISNPKIQAKMGNKMSEGMVAPYKKIVEN